MIELERALLHELRATHGHINRSHFRAALTLPQFSLTDASSFLARWLKHTRSIEFSRRFVLGTPWGSVLEVLKHEMAHQYVHEILREDEVPHGAAFRATCERLGIDASAAGLPRSEASRKAHPLLDRVQKLLALAQSDNRHEAEAAAAAAQRLILKHNIQVTQDETQRAYTFRHLGRITGRVSEWERRLGNILSEHFCVEVIWVPAYRLEEQKRGSVMEAIGSHENLELAAYVYDFLSMTAERAWLQHREAEGIKGNRERMTYLAGVMSGFADKLTEQARVHKRNGLVWVPHAELGVYTRKRHPYLRSITHQGHRRGDAFAHGQRAGRDVVLHRGLTQSGAGGETKLLRG